MKSLGKTILYVVFLVLFVSVNSYAVPVTFDGVNYSQAGVRSSAWAGFYNLNFGGEAILGMCDDYATDVITNGSWEAQRYSYIDIIEGDKGRWGDDDSKYNMIGYLFKKTFNTTDNDLLADINQAIWYISYGSLALTTQAAKLYKEALSYVDYTGWYGYMDILTPAVDDNGDPVSQEFLVRGSGVAPVPEPATLILLGTGLIGLAGLGRRKFIK